MKSEAPSALPVLIEAVRDEKIPVRKAAAWSLGQVGDPAAVPALTESLSDMWAVEYVATSLGAFGKATAIPALEMALNDYKVFSSRQAIKDALRRIHSLFGNHNQKI